jgi:hypothetical protein
MAFVYATSWIQSETHSFAETITLFIECQICATIKSGSLAVAASKLDIMAGGILLCSHLSMKSTNIDQYPIGKYNATSGWHHLCCCHGNSFYEYSTTFS